VPARGRRRHGGPDAGPRPAIARCRVTAVHSATAHVIRDAHVIDVPELVRLGWATEQDWPAGRIRERVE
jgi:hypothetical protein